MICVSLSELDFDSCLELVRKYECVELRLDHADFSLEQVTKLVSQSKKAIATFRPGKASLEKRLQSMETAIKAGALMIDIEIDAPGLYKSKLIQAAKEKGCLVIISHHDFTSTPGIDELKKLLSQCYESGADVAKIACMVNSPDDNARLLALYSIAGRKVIIGMGDLGRITRLAALQLGAEFTFAAPDKHLGTAAGQLSVSEFLSIQKILNTQ